MAGNQNAQLALIRTAQGPNSFQERSEYRNSYCQTRLPGKRVEVELHITYDTIELPKLLKTCIRYCNDATQDPLQTCAYYCDVLLSYFPDLENQFTRILGDCGATVKKIRYPEERRMEVVDGDVASVNLCYLGQAVLLLYKDLSFQEVTDRTNELRAIAGVPGNAKVVTAFNDHAAGTIRSVLGNNHEMRKSVFTTLRSVSGRTDVLGPVCNYLIRKLHWTDMDKLISVVDTLLVTKSPVLNDVRIADEVKNLAEAYNKVNACSAPQFFAIQEPPSVTYVMESTRFPTLIAVAGGIRGTNAGEWSTSLVAQLVRLHKNSVYEPDASSFSVQLVE